MKGFRGKYFSLTAILALTSTVTLSAQTTSLVEITKSNSTQAEFSEDEELTLSSEELSVAVISKKIKVKKSKVYSASKNYVSKTNVTDNVDIITSDELKLQGSTSINQALNQKAGISVTQSGGLGGNSSLFLQGMSNKYTLILIDGVRYNDPSNTSGSNLSNILTDDIERIEIIKGAQSGIWGADASAGVVNIITKKAKKGTHGSLILEGGSYQFKKASTSLSHRTRKFDAKLSLTRVMKEGFTSYISLTDDIDKCENDGYRNTTVNLKTGYWFTSNSRLELGFNDINSLSDYDVWGQSNSQATVDSREQSGYLKYKHFLGKNKIETILAGSSFENISHDTYSKTDRLGKTPTIEVKDSIKYTENSTMVFGAIYEKRFVESSSYNISNEEDSKSVYINNSNRLGNFIFSEAFRYDDFSEFGGKTAGKIGTKYMFNKKTNIYANYGTAFKAPNIMDMINPYFNGVSNFDLKPENIKSANIGFEIYGLNINLFEYKIEDMIEWQNYKNINIDGISKIRGCEVSYKKTFFDNFLIGTNYTYLDAKKENGERLLRRAENEFGAKLAYSFNKNLIFNINGKYKGSRADYGADMDSYFVANTNVKYKINKQFSIWFKVNNLTDEKYQDVYGYATASRSYYAGIKAKF